MFDCDDLFSSKELQRIFGDSKKIQACSTPISEKRFDFGISPGIGGKKVCGKFDQDGSKEANPRLKETVKAELPTKIGRPSKQEVKEKSQKPTTPVPEPKAKIRKQKGSLKVQHREGKPKITPNPKKSPDLESPNQNPVKIPFQQIAKLPPPGAPTESPPIAAKRFALDQQVPSTPPPPTKASNSKSMESLRIKALYHLLLEKCTPGPDPLTLLPYKKCSI